MKPVEKAKVVEQPVMMPPQQITDEQIVQVLNRLSTKAGGATIVIEDVMTEFRNIVVSIMNQKNSEIKALKEALAKLQIEKKLP